MRELTASPVSTDRYHLGEGCRWDDVTERLSWVDVFAGRLYEASYDGGSLAVASVVQIAGHLTAFAPLADRSAGWIVAADQGFGLLSRDSALAVLASPEAAAHGQVRMNDGACDPAGRFWAGSMAYDAAPHAGSLYRFDGASCARVLDRVTISNGIGWSPDGRWMYHIDSPTGRIRRYRYDPGDGAISDPTTLVSVDAALGVPDGLCVDSAGHLWVAIWGGGEVHRYSPAGEKVAVVSVAASQPSSCALGGSDRRQLFVTTARADLPEAVLDNEPDAGRLFSVTVDVPGLPLQPYLGRAAANAP